MGKTEATLGGKPKVPNEIKRKAASARTEGPIIVYHQVLPDQNEEFDDETMITVDYRILSHVIGEVISQRGDDCWSVALSRLLQAVYNMNLSDSRSFLEFMHNDLVHHLKKAELNKKVPSFI